jgi:5-methylcytosine-specific restriction enzyme subunit McrC
MKIPILNIYYMLCYAWNSLEESQLVDIDTGASTSLVDLFARVLKNGVAHLLKRGIDRGYVRHEEQTRTLRGKILFEPTLKQNLLTHGKVACAFDDLSYDILHNRILKATLTMLVRTEEIDPQLREELMQHRRRLQDVCEIVVSRKDFRIVQLHRSNSFYKFLLRICQLLHDHLLPTEKPGRWRFRDFDQDDKKMRVLFEEFVRIFYQREAKGFNVYRENINWQLSRLGEDLTKYLPTMHTDITLVAKDHSRKLIIDCKFTYHLGQERFGVEKFKSEHLYQITAYVNNLAPSPLNDRCGAILLYPTITGDVRADFQDLRGRTVSVRTVNLNQPWQGIHADLLAILN